MNGPAHESPDADAGRTADPRSFESSLVRLAKVFFVLFFIATLLNGSVFWLRRVGLMDTHFQDTYLAQFHNEDLGYRRTPEESEALRILTSEMYDVHGWLILTKLFKDMVLVAFLVTSLGVLLRGGPATGGIREAGGRRGAFLLLGLLLALVAVSGIVSWVRYGIPLVLAGARSLLFLPVAVLGGWAVRGGGWRTFTVCMGLLLPVQLLLAPVELRYGLPVFVGDRMVGTLLQPSSLGITAVVLLVAGFGAGVRGLRFGAAAAAVCALTYFTASATAWILLFLFSLIVLGLRLTIRQRRRFTAAGLVLGVLLALGLPRLTGRAEIYDSLSGRLSIAVEQVRQVHTPWEFLFGRGLGAGTNAAANLLMDWQLLEAEGYGGRLVFVSDSTPLAMYAQLGAVGCLLFYGILALAGWRDRQAWPLYFIMGLASLTTSITELYPVNIVLGLCLARSLMLDRHQESLLCATPI